MGPGEPLKRGQFFMDLGIILHGAGAQRVHARINAEIPCGQPRVMANQIHLTQLWKLRALREELLVQRAGVHVATGQRKAASSSPAFFPKEGLVKDEAGGP